VKTQSEVVINLVLDSVKEQKRDEKNAWIAAARRDFLPSLRAPCIVCGKHRAITHAHHLIPLAQQYDRGFGEPNHRHVWLCPNHHVVVHAFIDSGEAIQQPGAAATFLEDTTQEQRGTILEVVMRSVRNND
jgi:hypothetical protein